MNDDMNKSAFNPCIRSECRSEKAGETLCALGKNLLQTAEALENLGLRCESTTVGDQCPVNPGHKGASATRTAVQAGCELNKESAGEGAVEALNGVVDGGEIGGVQARLEKVCVVGAKGLRKDGSKRLVTGRRNSVSRRVGNNCAADS
ncbi:unnamed protein product [Fusarium graminearum]|nr:unnamed protein product [Fusarium graminearum]